MDSERAGGRWAEEGRREVRMSPSLPVCTPGTQRSVSGGNGAAGKAWVEKRPTALVPVLELLAAREKPFGMW